VCHNIRDRLREKETNRRKSERGRDSERGKMRRRVSFSLSFPSFFLVKEGEKGREGGPRKKGGREGM